MFFPNISKALELGANDLMIFKDYAIKNTTTIEEINNKFGQPKITTSSAFGGKAYSYFDSDYTYYLFFETDAAGKIKSYGAIGGNFKMSRYKEGNTVNNTDYYEGILTNLKRRYMETSSGWIRDWIEGFMVESECPTCHGARLKESVLSVYINICYLFQVF